MAWLSLLVVLVVASSALAAEEGLLRWDPDVLYHYEVDMKWYQVTGSGADLNADMLTDWNPPRSATDYGVRCQVSVQPAERVSWPPSACQGSDDGTTACSPNAWQLRVQPSFCVPLQSRFGGDFTPMQPPRQEFLESDPGSRRLRTPFYAVHDDAGPIRRVFFFPNETQSSRNMKRGMLSFLNFAHPPAHVQPRQLRTAEAFADGPELFSMVAHHAQAHAAAAAAAAVSPASGEGEASPSRGGAHGAWHQVDQDENGVYAAAYSAHRVSVGGAGDNADTHVVREVSHRRMLAGPQHAKHQWRRDAWSSLADNQAIHFRTQVVTISPEGSIKAVQCRILHGVNNTVMNNKASTHTSRRAMRTPPQFKAPEDAHPMRGTPASKPPIQYAEVHVHLLSETVAEPALRFGRVRHEMTAAADDTSEGTNSGMRRLREEASVEVALETAVPLTARDVETVLHASPDSKEMASLRAAASDYLTSTSTVPKGFRGSRRLLHRDVAIDDASHDEDAAPAPLVLLSVSPSVNVATSGALDVPHDLETHETGPDRPDPTGQSRAADPEGLFHYLECAEEVARGADGRHKAARCLLGFTNEARRIPALLDEALSYLHPRRLVRLREDYAHAPQAIMAAVSSIGTAPCQEALARLLLSIEHETPVVKTYQDAHDFFYVVNAITRIEDPLPVLFDAVHESMDMHVNHADQFHQLMLALGEMGRHLPQDHSQVVRARRVLEALFDDELEANHESEAVFHGHLAEAKRHLDEMIEDDRHMWMARCNHVPPREWAETWATATDAERTIMWDSTVDGVARVLEERSRPKGDDDVPPQHHGMHPRTLMALLTVQAERLRYSVQALANLGHPGSVDRVVGLAQHRRLAIRSFAVHALHAFPSPSARRVLLNTASSVTEDPTLRVNAMDALSEWPLEHLQEDGEVVDFALQHLAANDGVDWDDCMFDCTGECSERSVKACKRTCTIRCEMAQALEMAVVALVHDKWGLTTIGAKSDEEIHGHARRLAHLGQGDTQLADNHYRVVGARRLFSLLALLEDIFQYTKFDFVRVHALGWLVWVCTQYAM